MNEYMINSNSNNIKMKPFLYNDYAETYHLNHLLQLIPFYRIESKKYTENVREKSISNEPEKISNEPEKSISNEPEKSISNKLEKSISNKLEKSISNEPEKISNEPEKSISTTNPIQLSLIQLNSLHHSNSLKKFDLKKSSSLQFNSTNKLVHSNSNIKLSPLSSNSSPLQSKLIHSNSNKSPIQLNSNKLSPIQLTNSTSIQLNSNKSPIQLTTSSSIQFNTNSTKLIHSNSNKSPIKLNPLQYKSRPIKLNPMQFNYCKREQKYQEIYIQHMKQNDPRKYLLLPVLLIKFHLN